jgi:hypothetical protein
MAVGDKLEEGCAKLYVRVVIDILMLFFDPTI